MYMYLYLSNDSLETNGRLMELNHKTGKLQVNYGDRLVTLMREVRQLSGMGFAVPAKIQHVCNTAQKFYRHGVVLKQVRIQFFEWGRGIVIIWFFFVSLSDSTSKLNIYLFCVI